MNLPAILQRIERRLKVVGISADKASRLAGRPDAIRNMRRAVKEGRHGVSTITIAALAPVLRTTPAYLMAENGVKASAGTQGDALATERAALLAQIEDLTRQVEAIDLAMSIIGRGEKRKPAKTGT